MCRPRIAMAVLGASLVPLATAWVVGPQPSVPADRAARAVAEDSASHSSLELHSSFRGSTVPHSAEGTEEHMTPTWARALLAALAVVAAVVGVPRAVRAEGNVDVFFGQGCFWHVQHEFVKKEAADLGRKGSAITTLSGYAGGNEVGDKNRVCYHNLAMAPDYGRMGHTEVVNVSLPESKVGDFAKEYFDAAARYPFGRADPQDRGTEYRSAIGLPGGVDSPLFKAVEAANAGRMELVRGEGNDADTVGTKRIWVYDSNKYPFHQGEIYHQFHDDMLDRYSEGYHKLKDTLLTEGKIQKVECPEMGF